MLQQIFDAFPDETFLKIDGHDNAVLGVDEKTMKLCYSQKRIIKNLMKDMTRDEAVEFFEYNIAGSYVGEKTPILINDYL